MVEYVKIEFEKMCGSYWITMQQFEQIFQQMKFENGYTC